MKTLVVGLFITLLVVINQSNTDPWNAKETAFEWVKPSPELVYSVSNAEIDGLQISSFMEVSWDTSHKRLSSIKIDKNNAQLEKDVRAVCDGLLKLEDFDNHQKFCTDF
jgi:hypothetical protein